MRAIAVTARAAAALRTSQSLSLFSIPAGFHDQHQNDADSADEAPL